MQALLVLIDLLLKELHYKDKNSGHIPSYLWKDAEWEKSARVKRGLKSLKYIFNPEDPEDKGGLNVEIEPEQLVPVLLAILYCASENRYQNLYELRAANKLLEKYENEAIEIGQRIAELLLDNSNEIKTNIKLVARLIAFHKMADRVVHNRLAKKVYEKIKASIIETGGTSLQIGLVAAANYNVSGVLDKKDPLSKRIGIILNAWRESSNYPTDINEYNIRNVISEKYRDTFDVLWDYPLLMRKDSDQTSSNENLALWAKDHQFCNAALDGFSISALKKINEINQNKTQFLTLWADIEKEGEQATFITINYAQSRFLLEDDFRKELAEGKNSSIYNHAFFVEEKIASLNPSLGLGESVCVFEFRVNPILALRKARGKLKDQECNSKNQKYSTLEKRLRCIGDCDDSEKEQRYATLDDFLRCIDDCDGYVPLPILDRYFRIASTLANPGMFEEILLAIDGSLEPERPDTYSFMIPKRTALREAVEKHSSTLPFEARLMQAEAIIVRFICANAVNLGICFGFDRVRFASSKGPSDWVGEIFKLMGAKTAGFELLVRYIETYMRSHEVVFTGASEMISDENYIFALRELRVPTSNFMNAMALDEQDMAVAIDIGASTIKYHCYELTKLGEEKETNPFLSFRLSVKKHDGRKYTSLSDFADRLVGDLRQRIQAHFEAKSDSSSDVLKVLNRVRIFGISWPGVVRDGKLAGTSGIMENFEDSVASSWIRKTKVDQVRALDLASAVRLALRSAAKIKDNKDITVALCNDAYAEAMGRFILDYSNMFQDDKGNDIELRWCVLKLGTGTAGEVITKDRAMEGPTEFGKLVLDLFSTGIHDLGDEDKLPRRMVNEFASGKLLQQIYRQIVHCDTEPESREIGLLLEYFQGVEPPPDEVYQLLIHKIGVGVLHNKRLKSIVEMPEICTIEGKNPYLSWENWKQYVQWRTESAVLEGTDLTNMVKIIGQERLCLLLNYPLNKAKGPVPPLDLYNHLNSRRDDINNVFEKAGATLSDVVMLIHQYYQFNGITLCGGVISGATGEKIVKIMKKYLDTNYDVNFLEFTNQNANQGPPAQKKRTTIYYLINRDTKTKDRGEIGALYNALAIRRAKLVSVK